MVFYIIVAGQPTPILQGKCKSGFVSRGTSCYKFVKTPGQTWQNAASTCITEGGVLVSVNSVFENSYIESQMGPDVDYWIGLSRNKVNVFNMSYVFSRYEICFLKKIES